MDIAETARIAPHGDLAAFVGIVDDGGFAESARAQRCVGLLPLSRFGHAAEEQLKVHHFLAPDYAVHRKSHPKAPPFWLRRARF